MKEIFINEEKAPFINKLDILDLAPLGSDEESKELLNMLNKLSDEEKKIVSHEKIKLNEKHI